MPDAPSHLFVCGTLLSGSGQAIHAQLAAGSRLEGRGWVRAKFYDLGGYPGMVPSQNSADRVEGEVYELAPRTAEVLLCALDEYEGIGRTDVPAEYDRAPVDVTLEDGSTRRAWAYVLHDRHPRYPLITTSSYLEWLRLKGDR